MLHINIIKFLEQFQSSVEKKEFAKLQLTGKRDKNSELKKLIVTPIEIKKGYCLNFVYRFNTKDITKNFEIHEGINLISKALSDEFYNAEMVISNKKINLFVLPNDKATLKSSNFTLLSPTTFTHDKIKERLIELKGSVYLHALGITNAEGELRREMSDKYKQINQYIELLAPYFNEIKSTDKLHVVDMGSGKGYLTFALYDYLTTKLQLNIQTTGVEFRDDLVTICNSIAKQSNFDQLQFIKGTIADTKIDKIDILIALHACDTATDDAIYRGIMAEAELIVCAPCCHKQIRRAMNVDNELCNITRFGILKERQAEIITDTIRAMLLEAYGYKTNVFEFISLEHTPKNVMIVGKKNHSKKNDKELILKNIKAIKQIYGIEKHRLEVLLEL